MTHLEIETPEGSIQTLTGRDITQLDCLSMRAKQACWGTMPTDMSSLTAEQTEQLSALLVRMGRDCLDWLHGILTADSYAWLCAEYPAPMLPALVNEVLSAREVPTEAAKKFKLRRAP